MNTKCKTIIEVLGYCKYNDIDYLFVRWQNGQDTWEKMDTINVHKALLHFIDKVEMDLEQRNIKKKENEEAERNKLLYDKLMQARVVYENTVTNSEANENGIEHATQNKPLEFSMTYAKFTSVNSENKTNRSDNHQNLRKSFEKTRIDCKNKEFLDPKHIKVQDSLYATSLKKSECKNHDYLAIDVKKQQESPNATNLSKFKLKNDENFDLRHRKLQKSHKAAEITEAELNNTENYSLRHRKLQELHKATEITEAELNNTGNNNLTHKNHQELQRLTNISNEKVHKITNQKRSNMRFIQDFTHNEKQNSSQNELIYNSHSIVEKTPEFNFKHFNDKYLRGGQYSKSINQRIESNKPIQQINRSNKLTKTQENHKYINMPNAQNKHVYIPHQENAKAIHCSNTKNNKHFLVDDCNKPYKPLFEPRRAPALRYFDQPFSSVTFKHIEVKTGNTTTLKLNDNVIGTFRCPIDIESGTQLKLSVFCVDKIIHNRYINNFLFNVLMNAILNKYVHIHRFELIESIAMLDDMINKMNLNEFSVVDLRDGHFIYIFMKHSTMFERFGFRYPHYLIKLSKHIMPEYSNSTNILEYTDSLKILDTMLNKDIGWNHDSLQYNTYIENHIIFKFDTIALQKYGVYSILCEEHNPIAEDLNILLKNDCFVKNENYKTIDTYFIHSEYIQYMNTIPDLNELLFSSTKFYVFNIFSIYKIFPKNGIYTISLSILLDIDHVAVLNKLKRYSKWKCYITKNTLNEFKEFMRTYKNDLRYRELCKIYSWLFTITESFCGTEYDFIAYLRAIKYKEYRHFYIVDKQSDGKLCKTAVEIESIIIQQN